MFTVDIISGKPTTIDYYQSPLECISLWNCQSKAYTIILAWHTVCLTQITYKIKMRRKWANLFVFFSSFFSILLSGERWASEIEKCSIFVLQIFIIWLHLFTLHSYPHAPCCMNTEHEHEREQTIKMCGPDVKWIKWNLYEQFAHNKQFKHQSS